MPITVADGLPAILTLEKENIFVMPEQLLRLLSNTPLQIEVELLQAVTHFSKNTPSDHLLEFYKSYEDVKNNRYDGLVITGAPVEQIPFEEVDYWPELCNIMEWSKRNVFSTLHICWGAQAGLYYHYGIPKYDLYEKMFGVFCHKTLIPNHPLLRGFDDLFWAPHSRHTEIKAKDIEKVPCLDLLSCSDEAGVYIVAKNDGRQFFVTGHSEYDRTTLANEYFRDISKGLDSKTPQHYFPDDDPFQSPQLKWRSHSNLLYTNWLNYFVYQSTPFDLTSLE